MIFRNISLAFLFILGFISFASATTYTAVLSGQWSSTLTWGGTIPPNKITQEDEVVILAGVQVELDVDVEFDNVLSSCEVIGSLTSATNSLKINAGTLAGTGQVNVSKLEVGKNGAILLLGDLFCDTLNTSKSLLTISTSTTVKSELNLESGVCQLEGAGRLNLENQATVRISGGKLLEGTGVISNAGAINLIYADSSKSTGAELELDSIGNVHVQLKSGKDTLHLGADLLVTDTLFLERGRCDLNGFGLTLNKFVETKDSSSISGDVFSVLNCKGDNDMGVLVFTEGKNELSVCNLAFDGKGRIDISSELTIHDSLKLLNGIIALGEGDLILGASAEIFGGSDSSYVQTKNQGSLIINLKAGANATLFPIGSEENYSPCEISINPFGDTANIAARLINGVLLQGSSGPDISDTARCVNQSWFIETAQPQTQVDMNIRLYWKSDAEVNGFNRDNCYISHFINGAWDTNATAEARVEANGYFSIERTDIKELSAFRVVDRNISFLSEEKSSEGFEIYPNPANGKIFLNSSIQGEKTFRIYTLSGRMVKEQQTEGNYMDIAGLDAGMYLLGLHSESIFFGVKILVIR